jgi:hypothetical protein
VSIELALIIYVIYAAVTAALVAAAWIAPAVWHEWRDEYMRSPDDVPNYLGASLTIALCWPLIIAVGGAMGAGKLLGTCVAYFYGFKKSRAALHPENPND